MQVGGGFIVISTGWTMLKRRDEEERHEVHRSVQSQNAFPLTRLIRLTLPLTVGPGSISVAITLGANARHYYGVNLLATLAAIVGSVVIAFRISLCYGFAERLVQTLGATAMSVIMRLSSFLLVCTSGSRFCGTGPARCWRRCR